jgi:hypothetical protein
VHVQNIEFMVKSLTLITHVWLSPFLFSFGKIPNGSRAGSRRMLCVRAATAAATRHATRFFRDIHIDIRAARPAADGDRLVG